MAGNRAHKSQRFTRSVFNHGQLEYGLTDEAWPTATIENEQIRHSVFELQQDLNRLPTDTARAVILQREVEPWRRFDDSHPARPDQQHQFAVGFGNGDPDDEKCAPRDIYVPKTATLAAAERSLARESSAWACIISRPIYPWEIDAGAAAAVATVREHMAAAKAGDIKTLRTQATGPLLAAMGSLTDAELTQATHNAYTAEPSAVAFARHHAGPGHHHAFTNSSLHFDVDDSTGQWLIRQIRVPIRADQSGFLPGGWRPLVSPQTTTEAAPSAH